MTMAIADTKQIIMLGAGGHGKVLLELAKCSGLTIHGVSDPLLSLEGTTTWRGIPVVEEREVNYIFIAEKTLLINGIGFLGGNNQRQAVFNKYKAMGFDFVSLVHPQAWLARDVTIAEGVQIMAGVIVQSDCKIGANTIINTRSCIDHDSEIGEHAHVAPGCTICGHVTIGDGSFIGAGSIIVNGVHVAMKSFIRAGSRIPDYSLENKSLKNLL